MYCYNVTYRSIYKYNDYSYVNIMKFKGKYHKLMGKDKEITGSQIFIPKKLAQILNFDHTADLELKYDPVTNKLEIELFNS